MKYYYETWIKIKNKSHLKIKILGPMVKNLSLSTLSMTNGRIPRPVQFQLEMFKVTEPYLLLYLPRNWSKDDEIKNLTNKSRNTGIKRLFPVMIPRSARCLFISTRHLVCLDAV